MPKGNKRKNKKDLKVISAAAPPPEPNEDPKPLNSDDEREQAFQQIIKERAARVRATLESEGILGKMQAVTEKDKKSTRSTKSDKSSASPTKASSEKSTTGPSKPRLFASGIASMTNMSSATLPTDASGLNASFASSNETSWLLSPSLPGTPSKSSFLPPNSAASSSFPLSPLTSSFPKALTPTPTSLDSSGLFLPKSNEEASEYMTRRFKIDYPDTPTVRLPAEGSNDSQPLRHASAPFRKPKDAPFQPFDLISDSLNNKYSVRAHDFVLHNLQQLWVRATISTSPVYQNDSPTAIARFFLSTLPKDLTHGEVIPEKRAGRQRALTDGTDSNTVPDSTAGEDDEQQEKSGESSVNALNMSSMTPLERWLAQNASAIALAQQQQQKQLQQLSHSTVDTVRTSTTTTADGITTTPTANPPPPSTTATSTSDTKNSNVQAWRKISLLDMHAEQQEAEQTAAVAAATDEYSGGPTAESKPLHDFEPYQKWIVIWATAFVKRVEGLARARRMEALAPLAEGRAKEVQGGGLVHPALRNDGLKGESKEKGGVAKDGMAAGDGLEPFSWADDWD